MSNEPKDTSPVVEAPSSFTRANMAHLIAINDQLQEQIRKRDAAIASISSLEALLMQAKASAEAPEDALLQAGDRFKVLDRSQSIHELFWGKTGTVIEVAPEGKFGFISGQIDDEPADSQFLISEKALRKMSTDELLDEDKG